MNFMCFICCEVSFSIRSNAVWNTLTVNKSFCKTTVLAEVLCAGKTDPYWLVYSSKNVLIFVSVLGSFLKGDRAFSSFKEFWVCNLTQLWELIEETCLCVSMI